MDSLHFSNFGDGLPTLTGRRLNNRDCVGYEPLRECELITYFGSEASRHIGSQKLQSRASMTIGSLSTIKA